MIDFASLSRPSSPNTYLVAPADLCRAATPDRIAPVFAGAAERVRDAFLNLMRGSPRVSEGPANADPLAYEFVERTPLMGFKDDIAVVFIPLAVDRSTLAIYSRSRVGYSDLGANKKRIEAWLGVLTGQFGEV
jgi:uncharacterized protein (DUF1499 family)